MTSQEQLILWTGTDVHRSTVAAWAEGEVAIRYPAVMHGSEEFYTLVLAHTLEPGK